MSGDELALIRVHVLGMTQAATAQVLGITKQTLARWEQTGIGIPDTLPLSLAGVLWARRVNPAASAAELRAVALGLTIGAIPPGAERPERRRGRPSKSAKSARPEDPSASGAAVSKRNKYAKTAN